MCGIAGKLDWSGKLDEESRLATARQMLAAIAHRGPDDAAIYIDSVMTLGHRRLAILDLSERGRQPMSDHTQRYWIAYNGEVYNFAELRSQLESLGHRFQSNTDTEVVLMGYVAWGESVLEKLNGMFAIAIWDAGDQRLWLARDGIGIKPLYYRSAGNQFLFGSEIKAILADDQHPARPDWDGLTDFFTFGYCGAPRTGFEGVKQLEPGFCLTVDRERVESRKWYRLPYPDRPPQMDGRDAVEALQHALDDAVKRQMVSDVPIGAFLSGGLDSSAIVRSMTRLGADVRTFTISFDQQSFDESPFAEQVAKHYASKHQCRPMKADLSSILQTLVSHAEDPLADNSLLPMFLLCSSLVPDVKVALSGDGADELLAGYVTYRADALAQTYHRLPGPLRNRVIKPLVNQLPASDRKYHWASFAKRFVAGAELPYPLSHCAWRQMISPEVAQRVFSSKHIDLADQASLQHYAGTLIDAPDWLSPLEQQLHMDLRFHLPNDMLAKVDRMSMAHSIEVRVPFLDQQVIQACLAMAPRSKRIGKRGKRVLRSMLRSDLPSSIVDRSKSGFVAPIERWMASDWQPLLRSQLNDDFCRETEVLNGIEVHRMIDEQTRGRDHAYSLFTLFIFSIWWKIWIAKTLPITTTKCNAEPPKILSRSLSHPSNNHP